MATSTIKNEFRPVVKEAPTSGTLTIVTSGRVSFLISARGPIGAMHGAWLVSGYGVLTGGRCTITEIDPPSACSISVPADNTITIENSNSTYTLSVCILPLIGNTPTITS